jgi:hypothetical protein
VEDLPCWLSSSLKERFLLVEHMEVVVIIEEGVFFFASDQLWRRETIGLGLSIELGPCSYMQIQYGEIWSTKHLEGFMAPFEYRGDTSIFTTSGSIDAPLLDTKIHTLISRWSQLSLVGC